MKKYQFVQKTWNCLSHHYTIKIIGIFFGSLILNFNPEFLLPWPSLILINNTSMQIWRLLPNDTCNGINLLKLPVRSNNWNQFGLTQSTCTNTKIPFQTDEPCAQKPAPSDIPSGLRSDGFAFANVSIFYSNVTIIIGMNNSCALTIWKVFEKWKINLS